MTLQELLVKMDLRVPHPPAIGNLELEGFSTTSSLYCPFRLEKYFCSPKFQEDLEKIQYAFQDGIEHGFSPDDYQIFVEDNGEGSYHLELDLVWVPIDEQ